MGERILRLLLAGSVLLPAATAAQPRPEQEEEGDKKPRAELEVTLPPYPKSGSLIPFDVSAASSNRFYIDPQSISIGSDGIVRYTLVIRSPSGAENVSYEGIRCGTREQKYYAFGRRDGTWSKARSGEWRYIEYKDINRQYGVLYADFFCPDRKPVRSPEEVVNRFVYGVPTSRGDR